MSLRGAEGDEAIPVVYEPNGIASSLCASGRIVLRNDSKKQLEI